MFTHREFSTIPDSALKDIPAEQPGNSGDAGNAQHSASMEDELHNTGKHTENAGAGSPGSGAATEGSKPAGKKNLSQLTGGKGGKFAVNILNIVIPALLCLLINRFGYSVDKKVFKLTGEERELMEPVMQELLDSVYVDLNNPWAQFALVFGMIYGSKVMDAVPEAKKVVRGQKESEPIKADGSVDIEQKIRDEYDAWELKRIDELKTQKKKNAAWVKKYMTETGEDRKMWEKISRKYEQQKQAA